MALEWTETLVSGDNVRETLLREYVWWAREFDARRCTRDQAMGALSALDEVAASLGMVVGLELRARQRMSGE